MATPPPDGHSRGQQRQPYVRLPALILTAVVLALFAAGVAAFVVGQRPTTDSEAPPSLEEGHEIDAVVGQCIQVNNADVADIAVVDCAEPAAVYKVAVRLDTSTRPCPASSYVSYSLQGTLRLCLVLNARPGECFDESGQRDTRVDCADRNASFRVARVLEGAADPTMCGESNAPNAIVYPEPRLTLCRVPLD